MRDQKIEKMLDELEIVWEYNSRIELEQIDENPSWRSQVRLETPLDEDHAESIAVAAGSGKAFPAFILRELDNGRYEIVDARHRYFGFSCAGIDSSDAYIICCAPGDARMVAIEANRSHGKGFSKHEKIEHASALMNKGYSAEEAARLNDIRLRTLEDHRRRQELQTKLLSSGMAQTQVKFFNDCSQATISKLRAITNDDTRLLAAELVVVKRMRGEQMESFLIAVRDGEAKGNAAEIIHDWNKKIKKPGSTMRRRREWYQSIIRTAKSFITATRVLDDEKMQQLTTPELKEIWNDGNDVRKAAIEVCAKLNEYVKQSPGEISGDVSAPSRRAGIDS